MRRILVLLATMVTGVLLASGLALAAEVSEVEPNDSFAEAQDIDDSFDLTENADITDSTTVPHATVIGTGDDTVDYYTFTVPEGTPVRVILDMDHTTPDDTTGVDPQYDPWIELYDSNEEFLELSDDAGGDPGSTPDPPDGDDPNGYDSSIFKTLDPGVYYVAVGSFPELDPVPAGATYQLHVSVGNGPNPPDTTITDGPAQGSTVNDASATFNFSATEDATFECSLDGEPFTSCDGPMTISVSGGTHTFEVRATDLEGNVDTTPDSRTWTYVDVTGPTIVSTNPQPGATKVVRTDPITVTFSEPMETIPESSFTLQKVKVQGRRVTPIDDPLTFTLDQSDPTVVTLTPTVTLDKGSYYRVTIITTGVTDEAGNELQTGTTWLFKTAPK